MILLAARVSPCIFEWRRIGSQVAEVFDESSAPSLNRVITLLLPYLPWYYSWSHPRNTIPRWAAAVAAVPYSEEVGSSVVSVLLRILAVESLRSRIPVEIWTWLKNRPPLPPVCLGRLVGSWRPIVRHVRGLGDIEILKSYLLLTWSEWDSINPGGRAEMEVSIREDFGGIEMWSHRDDLVKRLDQVRAQLDQGLEKFTQHKPRTEESFIHKRKEQYGQLKNVLLEVDERAMETLTRTAPMLVLSFQFVC